MDYQKNTIFLELFQKQSKTIQKTRIIQNCLNE